MRIAFCTGPDDDWADQALSTSSYSNGQCDWPDARGVRPAVESEFSSAPGSDNTGPPLPGGGGGMRLAVARKMAPISHSAGGPQAVTPTDPPRRVTRQSSRMAA